MHAVSATTRMQRSRFDDQQPRAGAHHHADSITSLKAAASIPSPLSSDEVARSAPAVDRNPTPTSWRSIHPAARLYVRCVVGLGATAILHAVAGITERDAALLATLTMLSLTTSFAKIHLPVLRSSSTLSICYVIDFTTLLLLGPSAATITAAAGAWSQCTFRCRQRGPAYQTWFSIAALAMTVQAAGWTYRSLGGEPGLLQPGAHMEALIAAATVFFLANSVLVAGAVGLSTGQPTLRVWIANYAWIWPGHLLGFSLAVVAAAGIERSTLWLLPLAGTLLALTYGNLKAYVTDSATDPLTELPNLRYLVTHVAQELARSQRDRAPMALIVIDVDHFKFINDTYGHRAGDAALRLVAQQLQESVRSYDICARYGGDEFVVMLPGCGAEDARRKAATLQRAVSQLKCEPTLGVTEPLRISAGVAVFPSDGETFEQLLTVADGRMFQDKAARTGRTAATVEESASVVAFRPRLQT